MRAQPFLDIAYPGLAQTLRYVKQQAIDSIPYFCSTLPDYIDNPESLFYYLKNRTRYQSDPRGIEYIQKAETLFEQNAGRGDCDCFTAISLAALHCIGVKNLYTVIVGKMRFTPTHIYVVFYKDNERFVFDLTNSVYNFERNSYKYIQELKTKL